MKIVDIVMTKIQSSGLSLTYDQISFIKDSVEYAYQSGYLQGKEDARREVISHTMNM